MIVAIIALLLTTPGCYQPPINSPIVDRFRAPVCPFCPGNRGLEYQPPAGSSITAAAPGTVTFSGLVAGVRYVVIAQTDGRTATYGRLAAANVALHSAVSMGDLLGTTTARFYFGLREGDRYIDPEPFLGTLHYRPRLIPVDGSAPRRAPPPTMRCAASGVGERASRR